MRFPVTPPLRSVDEVKHWDTVDTPRNRIRNYLATHNWWDDGLEKEFRSETRTEILRSFRDAENTKLPNPLQVGNMGSVATLLFGGLYFRVQRGVSLEDKPVFLWHQSPELSTVHRWAFWPFLVA